MNDATVLRTYEAGRLSRVRTFPESNGRASELAPWAHRLRHRHRWQGTSEETALATAAVTSMTTAFGLALPDALRRASIVEIAIPAGRLELLAVPWEGLIGLTGGAASQPQAVLRCVEASRSAPPATPWRYLVVRSAPDPIWDSFDFKTEELLLRRAIDARTPGVDLEVLINPTIEELRESAKGFAVVHLAGLDDTQLQMEFPDLQALQPGRHGLIVQGQVAGSLDAISGPELAALICQPAVQLVTCNYSCSGASHVGALVRGGVATAIGIHDELPDLLTEAFFAEYYRRLSRVGAAPNPVATFLSAWAAFRDRWSNELGGSGIVCCSQRSYLRDSEEATRLVQAAKSLDPATNAAPPLAPGRSSNPPPPGPEMWAEVDVFRRLPVTALNHRISPFREFRLLAPSLSSPTIATVDVELFDGSGGATNFHLQERVSLAVTDLGRRIALPTPTDSGWSSDRKESIVGTLRVRLKVGESTVYDDSHHVELPPACEWEFDGRWQRALLPAHVLPNDPCVRKIVRSATTILKATSDAQGIRIAGFSGSDDGARLLSFHAIWYAIAQIGLNFAPASPISFGQRQRLRHPSDILDGCHGTCLDLAILIAACLEYAQQFPVIVLFEGHALVGCWRTSKAHKEFIRGDIAGLGTTRSHPWTLYSEQREAFKNCLDHLYLVDPVSVTENGHFSGARTNAHDYALESGGTNEKKFHQLTDIVAARRGGVLPLPLVSVNYPKVT